MNYEFCLRTDTGLLRENNEDSVLLDEVAGLAVLADGMGGYNAGEVASSMATRHIADGLTPWLVRKQNHADLRELHHALADCVGQANSAVFNASRSSSLYSGMGTTLVVGVFQPFRLVLGHIGDSRCYRWRQPVLTQLTRDHSLLQEQIDAGLLTPEQAATSTHRNLVTRALGVTDAVELELGDHPVEPGDLFLMCSDGLSDMVADADIARVLASGSTLGEKATQLVAQANANGGRDNISVLLIQAGNAPARRSLLARFLKT